MPTPEEIAAETAAKEAADKKAAEEAKAKAEQEANAKAEQEASFDAWLATQPKEVQEKYSQHTAGLKSALDKEREANKDAKGAAEKLAKYEAEAEAKRKAEMTELDRLKAEKAEAETKAKQMELSQMRRDAADKAGLPLEFAERLKGETPEELEADAKKVKELVPEPKKQQQSIKTVTPGADGLPANMTDEQKNNFLWGKRS